MKSEPRTPGSGKKIRYRVGRRKTFFDNKSKLLKMSYREISVFLILFLFFIIVLFRNVIIDFLISPQ